MTLQHSVVKFDYGYEYVNALISLDAPLDGVATVSMELAAEFNRVLG